MSCRQLSPRVAFAILLLPALLLLVLAPPPASAATTVQSVVVVTDRVDYVNVPGFNRVTATATVDFNGNGPLDTVRFDWTPPGGGTPFLSHYVVASQVGVHTAQASDVWPADREGIGFSVFAGINYTVGGGPLVGSPPAYFNVYNRSRFVTVTDLVVVTSAVYENGTLATARADLKYAGNASLLGGVRFDWYYPDWTLASSTTDPSPQPVSPQLAQAWSTWTIDRAGQPFHVNGTYLGDPPVTNTTSFDVLDRQVRTWLPVGNIGAGRTILDRASSPWGVCFNVSVDPGGELFIEPGVVIRFCKGTGLFVNGTLTIDALQSDKVYLLSLTAAGVPMQAGDWRGITFFAAAPSNRSLLSYAVVQAVTEGLTIRGTAVRVLNSRIALATGPAVWLTNSSSLVGNNTIGQADIGIRCDACSGAVLDSNTIQGARVGVVLEDSVATLSANDISLNAHAGLQAIQSRVTVDGGSFRDDGDIGVYLSGVPQAHLIGVGISGGNDSLSGENSRGIIVELSTLAGARYRSAYFINATSTFVNSTLAALQRDLVLVASPTTLVNSTTAAPNLQINSWITVRNYVHVLVESNLPGMLRVANAWANVTSNDLLVSSRRTTAAGWSLWILLTDRVILDATRTNYVRNVAEVWVAGFSVVSSPRVVNMSASHVERFLVVPTNSNPSQFFLGLDGVVLITIAVLMGTVLLVMPVMRRRKQSNGTWRVRPAAKVALEPGTSYVVPDEKPDRAFQIFSSQLGNGSRGIVVSRIYPDEARRRYGLRDVPVLWLSRGYGKDTVNPTNLGALVHELERFMSGKEDSVVLLDGLEYLLVQNDPQKVVKFVETLADTASVHHAKVLIPFNMKSVTEAQRALLTRDLQTL